MSYVNTVAKFKNPIGCGYGRIVYYSKKYNYVFKMIRRARNTEQSRKEITIFHKMSEDDRTAFPMVDCFFYKNLPVVVMEYCKPLDTVTTNYRWNYELPSDSIASLSKFIKSCGLSTSNVHNLFNFIKDFDVIDLTVTNLGINEKNNTLVIIDAGWD
jgi:hypothetical protein